MENALIPLDNINPVEVFVNDGLGPILQEIERKATEQTYDIETARGRQDCKSMAYKVARSKTVLDNFGKDLVSDWKEKSKKVDIVRKQARDFLEDLQSRVRKPLTDFEAAEEARIAAEKAAAELLADWESALSEDDLFNRKKEIVRKEAEFARIEAEKKAKEEAERLAQERKEREERIAREAAERAKREAQEAIERAEREKIAAIERAKIEAEQAEKRRIEAERLAKESQARAVREAEERERERLAKIERERLAKEAAEKAEADRKAKLKSHRKKINADALACFEMNGIESDTARAIIDLIADGLIDHITINY